MLNRDFKSSLVLELKQNVKPGDVLQILVENRGRLDFWSGVTYPTLEFRVKIKSASPAVTWTRGAHPRFSAPNIRKTTYSPYDFFGPQFPFGTRFFKILPTSLSPLA